MYHLNRFQNLVVRVCRIKPFNVEQALRQQWRDGKASGIEEGRKEKHDCLRCPLYKQYQIRLQGIDTDAGPTTDGKTPIQSPRQRHITRDLQQQDALLRHEVRMSQQKRRITSAPRHTEMLPNARHMHKMGLTPVPPDWLT